MFRLKLVFPLLLGALCLACPTPAVVQGQVTTAPTGDGESTAIEGAQLELDCPDQRLLFIGITNRAGEFHYSPSEPTSTDCSLKVSQPGYETQRYPVCDVCSTDVCAMAAAEGSEEMPTCPEIDFVAELPAE